MDDLVLSVDDWNLTALKLVTGICEGQLVLAAGALEVFKLYARDRVPSLLAALFLEYPERVAWVWEHLIAVDGELEALLAEHFTGLLVESLHRAGLVLGRDFTVIQGKIQGNSATMAHLKVLWSKPEAA